MQGRYKDHPLYRHVEMIAANKAAIPQFVGVTLAEQRYIDWIKGGSRRDEWICMIGESNRDPVTSVLVVLARDDTESRQAVDVMLKKVTHGILVFGFGGVWPPTSFLKRD